MKTTAYALTFALAFSLLAAPALAGYDKPSIGETVVYKAKYEDTFVHLARDYNLGYTEMRAANPSVDPWLPGDGTKIILPLMQILPDAPHEGIVINLPEMRLFAYVNGEEPPSTYPIGVGREGLLTPTGAAFVARKMVDPIWRPTDRMLKEHPDFKPEYGPGPDNPLGNRILYLNWPTYGIHGTNRPFGIGRRVSSGCIRMYPESILELYDKVPIGTKVTVVNQPIKLAWVNDKLYIEAHPDIDQATQMEENGYVTNEKLTDADMREILKIAGKDQDKLHWAAIRKAVRERAGYPIVIARRMPTGEVVADNESETFPMLKESAQEEHKTASADEEEVFETPEGKEIQVEDKMDSEPENAPPKKAEKPEEKKSEKEAAEDKVPVKSAQNDAPLKILNQ